MSLMRFSSRVRLPMLGRPTWSFSWNAGAPPRIAKSAMCCFFMVDRTHDGCGGAECDDAAWQVSQHERTSADDGAGTDAYAVLDDAADAEPRAAADLHATAEAN